MQRRSRRFTRFAVAALLAGAWVAGCASGNFDARELAARVPALGELPGHRLGDLTPFFWPVRDELTLFLCRWPDARPIPIALPSGVDPELVRAAEIAVSAIEEVLPIRFERRDSVGDHGIELRFIDSDKHRVIGAGNAVADCALDTSAALAGSADRLPAEIVYASVWLRVDQFDALGRLLAFTPEQVAGSVLHELGHALGYPGHAHAGKTVMVESVEDVRDAGRDVLAGKPFRDATLEALYRVPSGTVVRRMPLESGATRYVDAMLALAPRAGLQGPTLRIGDRLARISWRDAEGRSFPIFVDHVEKVLRGSADFELDLHTRTRRLLGAANTSEAPIP